MNIEITNLRRGTKIAVFWRSQRVNGYNVPSGSWIHVDGSTTKEQRGIPQKFGLYGVCATLDGFQTFEHMFPVTEELTVIKVSYKKIKEWPSK